MLREGSLATEIQLQRKDGSLVDVDLNVVELPDGSVYGSCRDISDRKRAVAQLGRSEERFRLLFENTLAPIIIADEAGNYLAANDAACKLVGYSREQLLQMKVADLVSTTPESSAELFEAYKAGGPADAAVVC